MRQTTHVHLALGNFVKTAKFMVVPELLPREGAGCKIARATGMCQKNQLTRIEAKDLGETTDCLNGRKPFACFQILHKRLGHLDTSGYLFLSQIQLAGGVGGEA